MRVQECFAEHGYSRGDLPVSEAAVREVLSLPVYPELREAQLHAVADALEAAVSEE